MIFEISEFGMIFEISGFRILTILKSGGDVRVA